MKGTEVCGSMVAISLRGPGMDGSVADSVKRSTRTRPRGGEGGVEEEREGACGKGRTTEMP